MRHPPSRGVSSSELIRGTSNRIFDLEFDDGSQLIAKIPFPIAGPPHFTTASEVATMYYAREMLRIPVPRVISWCSRAENTPVKSEYIIMEKVQGVQLYDHWVNLGNKPWFQFASDLVKMEKRLTDADFSNLGSLYFERDLPTETQRTSIRFIDKDGANVDHNGLCIGPSVDRRFWRGERTNMQIDRGPCTSVPTFAR